MAGKSIARNWFFVVGGLPLLMAALGTWRWAQQSAVAQDNVTRLNAGGSHAEIEFTAAPGETISYAQGGLVVGWRVGDPVPVRYDPAAPARDPPIDWVLAIWTMPMACLMRAWWQSVPSSPQRAAGLPQPSDKPMSSTRRQQQPGVRIRRETYVATAQDGAELRQHPCNHPGDLRRLAAVNRPVLRMPLQQHGMAPRRTERRRAFP